MSIASDDTRREPLLAVESLSKSFRHGTGLLRRLSGKAPTVRAVDDVSLTIARGETLGLVGESGCGKSTLARMVMGLERPSSGTIRFDRQPLAQSVSERPATLRRSMQMIFQDPYTSLNGRWRVRDIVAEPIREGQGSLSDSATTEQVAALLVKVGLSADDLAKYPHQFSGGQRQRIAIARAIATAPAFLVCDEPTSALDVSVQAQILNLMSDLREQNEGLTSLFISHNLAAVRHFADRVGVMYLGRLVELAPTEALFEAPQHPYTQMLLAAVPGKRRGHGSIQVRGELPNPLDPPTGCAFHPRCQLATGHCRAERPRLAKLHANPGRNVACHLST